MDSLTISSSKITPVDPSAAVQSIAGILTGPLGTSLACIAFAWFGIELLTGRSSLRKGGLIALGAFILFGAPAIAAALMRVTYSSSSVGSSVVASEAGSSAPSTYQLPPASSNANPFDPYAGASAPGRQR